MRQAKKDHDFLMLALVLASSLLIEPKKEPGKNFIIIEPLGFADEELPKNLIWISGHLTDQETLPFKDASIDEVNMNFSLSAIFADFPDSDEEFAEYLPRLLRERL